ncbi:hypothetical protein TrVE_jg6952 [Triparma verrucosa]|uniref:Uncharacterized protein n=1 Tax=Triparma verrucosa TaxID=1606542 RepID=A0A9W7EPS9_9STRA|nr:hypothetical protein TrVE_jg6952 [Triparma verrucosa]
MISIHPSDGSPVSKPVKANPNANLPSVSKQRKNYWPQGRGYETREERARRENRVVSRERQRRQNNKPRPNQQHNYQYQAPATISGPELLMTLNRPDVDFNSYREAFPMYDDEMPYSPESPTKSLLQVPSPVGSPTLSNFETGSPLSHDGSPSLQGLKVDLSPKNRSPQTKPLTKSNNIFGKSNPNPNQTEPVYSVNYFGVHHGEMGVLSQKRKIPTILGGGRPRTGTRAATAKDPNLSHLTPFGRQMAQTVLAPEDVLPPNVRLDPSYVYLRSATTAPAFSEHINMYMNSRNEQQQPVQNTGGAISPLHEGFNDPQAGEPVAFVGANDVPDDNSVNTMNTQHSNLTASSFERNQTLSPSKAHRNQGMEQVEEDDRTLDSEMNKSYFSRSTLGVPNPGMYDQWLTNNALPGISRSLSRGGLGSAGLLWENAANDPGRNRAMSPPSNAMMHNKGRRLHSDHGMGPATPQQHFDQTSQIAERISERSSVRSRGNHSAAMAEDEGEPIPYIVHSAPMGWKLTTPARKKYVEATAQLAGYGDNEFLPLPDKLSELGSTMGLPDEFDRSLRAGNSGPAPKLFRKNPKVNQRSKEAAQRAVDRKAPPLKWRGLDSHRIQLKKVDAMLRSTLSSSNRPSSLVDPGESVYGAAQPTSSTVSLGRKVVKVGGRRTTGRQFKSQSQTDLHQGTGVEDTGSLEGGPGPSMTQTEQSFSYTEMFGAGRIV